MKKYKCNDFHLGTHMKKQYTLEERPHSRANY